jgi:hypothetical protein
MTQLPDFTFEIFQNEYLPDGSREVNAVVTINAAESVGQDRPVAPSVAPSGGRSRSSSSTAPGRWRIRGRR